MVELIAAQHFFSSVPASESPHGRRGYQTLFATQGLSADAVKTIEDFAQYNAPDGLVKYQYYPLPGGLFAVAQSIALDERDEFGRRGRYLTHTLVLPASSLAQLGYCPLDILQQFTFAANLATVYAQGDRANGHVATVRLSIQPQWTTTGMRALRTWPRKELNTLGTIAWSEWTGGGKTQAIALLGSTAESWQTLAALFVLATASQRQRLSFDTLADGCNWTDPDAIRLLGYTDERAVSTPCRLYIDRKTSSGISGPTSNTLFTRWMATEGLERLLAGHDISREQHWVLGLQNVLTGTSSQTEQIPLAFLERFAQANSHLVVQQWLAHLPADLSAELTAFLSAAIRNDSATHLEILVNGITDSDLDIFLFDELLVLRHTPSKPEQRGLQRWARDHQAPRVDTLIALWNRDTRMVTQHLNLLEHEDYERLAAQLIQWPDPPVPLWALLVQPHAELWIRWVAPALDTPSWRKALPVLNELGFGKVDQLAAIVDRLAPNSLKEIRNWLQHNPGIAPRLETRLNPGDAPEKPQRRFWGRR